MRRLKAELQTPDSGFKVEHLVAALNGAPAEMTTRDLEAFLKNQRVGHLATVDTQGRPVVVPLCFAYNGKAFYSSVDEKPKTVSPQKLRRSQNIQANPEVALVLDHYEEDWGRLRFALIRGRARMLFSGKEHDRALVLLRKKYPQYRAMRLERRPVIKIVPWKILHWTSHQ